MKIQNQDKLKVHFSLLTWGKGAGLCFCSCRAQVDSSRERESSSRTETLQEQRSKHRDMNCTETVAEMWSHWDVALRCGLSSAPAPPPWDPGGNTSSSHWFLSSLRFKKGFNELKPLLHVVLVTLCTAMTMLVSLPWTAKAAVPAPHKN